MRLRDVNDRIERGHSVDPRAYCSDVGMVAKSLLMARIEGRPAVRIAESLNAPDDVLAVLKAAIGASRLVDFGPYAAMVGTYLETLRSASVFARLLAGGMREAPLQTPIRAVSVAITGTTKSEGYPTPVSRMTLAAPLLQRLQAVALVAITKEIVVGTSPAAMALLDAEIRSAVAVAVDAPFISIASTGAPSIISTGSDADATLLDLRALLARVNATGAGSLYWVMPPDIANRAATMSGLAGALLFPNMSPTGGVMLGLPALVSSQVPANELLLIDASGLVGTIDSIDVVAAEHASVSLRDDPTNAAAELTSLWQANAIAIRATVGFGLERFRANAVARLTSIGWGGGVPNS